MSQNIITIQTKITLLLLSLLTMMSNVAIVTALPHLSHEYANTPHIELLSRLMLTLPSLVVALFAPFASRYIYQIGLKKSVMIALLLFSIAGSSGLFISDIYLLLFSRVCFGIGVSVIMIVSTTLAGNLFSGSDRDKFMSMQMAFTAIGGMLFVFTGGILSDIHYNYSFGIYSIGIIVLLMVYLFIPKDTRGQTSDSSIIKIDAQLYKVYLLGFIVSVLFFILPTQFPFLLINHFHASGKLAALIISSAFISNALGAIAFRMLRKRFSHAAIYLIGLFVMAGGMMLIGHISHVNMFFISSPMIGFSAGILMTNISVWMLSYTNDQNRIKSVSYLTTAMFFGQFMSPILTYPLVLSLGVTGFFSVMSYSIIASIAISLAVLGLTKRRYDVAG